MLPPLLEDNDLGGGSKLARFCQERGRRLATLLQQTTGVVCWHFNSKTSLCSRLLQRIEAVS